MQNGKKKKIYQIYPVPITLSISWYYLPLSPLSFYSGLFHLWISRHPLLQIGISVKKRKQNGIQCTVLMRWPFWAVLFGTTQFAKVSVLVYRVERVKKIYFTATFGLDIWCVSYFTRQFMEMLSHNYWEIQVNMTSLLSVIIHLQHTMLLCFWQLSESCFLFGSLHRRRIFENCCHD